MNEEKLQNAMSDISLIRQTMDKSRVQMRRLSNLFFLYGGIQLFLVGGYLIWDFFFSSPNGELTESYYLKQKMIIWGFLWAYHLVYFVIAIFWLLWRRELKKTDNNYTLYVYDSWGLALFAMPIFWILCMAISPMLVETELLQAMMTLLWLVEQIMFFIGLAMTGFFLNSEDWKILSVIFLIAYMISLIWVSGSSGCITLSAYDLLSHWFSVEAVWAAICPLISLGLGCWFRYQRRFKF